MGPTLSTFHPRQPVTSPPAWPGIPSYHHPPYRQPDRESARAGLRRHDQHLHGLRKVTVNGAGDPTGVTVAISGTVFTTTTHSDGSYTLSNVPYGTTGDITPSKAGYTFNPVNIPIASLVGDLSAQNFIATLNTYKVSGKVTVNGAGDPTGVTVAISGTVFTTTTGSDGSYTLSNVPYGTTGDITPARPGIPSTRSISLLPAWQGICPPKTSPPRLTLTQSPAR